MRQWISGRYSREGDGLSPWVTSWAAVSDGFAAPDKDDGLSPWVSSWAAVSDGFAATDEDDGLLRLCGCVGLTASGIGCWPFHTTLPDIGPRRES